MLSLKQNKRTDTYKTANKNNNTEREKKNKVKLFQVNEYKILNQIFYYLKIFHFKQFSSIASTLIKTNNTNLNQISFYFALLSVALSTAKLRFIAQQQFGFPLIQFLFHLTLDCFANFYRDGLNANRIIPSFSSVQIHLKLRPRFEFRLWRRCCPALDIFLTLN